MLFAQLINDNELKNWKYFIIIYSFFLHLMNQFPLSFCKPFDIISPTRTTFGLCKIAQLLSASNSCNFSFLNLNSQSVGESLDFMQPEHNWMKYCLNEQSDFIHQKNEEISCEITDVCLYRFLDSQKKGRF